MKTSSSYILSVDHGKRLNLSYQIMINSRKFCQLPHMEQITRTATNYLIPSLMDYNTTAVHSSQNMYPTAYISNSSWTTSFSSTVKLNVSVSPQVLIHVVQSLKKQHSDTRYRCIVIAKDVARTYRCQSVLMS